METMEPLEALAGLKEHRYLNLTTFRKSGTPVVTTVWFALEDGTVYVTTKRDSGKTKRIRANPRVQIAPSTARGVALGSSVDAVAEIVPAAEQERARRALHRVYGWQVGIVELLERLGLRENIYLAIVPVELDGMTADGRPQTALFAPRRRSVAVGRLGPHGVSSGLPRHGGRRSS